MTLNSAVIDSNKIDNRMGQIIEDQQPKIFHAMTAIMRDLDPIAKAQYNNQQKFAFRGIEDVYNHLQAVLAKHNVFTLPTILGRERFQVESRSGGKMWHVVIHYRYKFYCSDGSYVEADADGEAMDSGDKASNKCASIAHKYALIQAFCIPTKDLSDPDQESPQPGSAAQSIGSFQGQDPFSSSGAQAKASNPDKPGLSEKQLKRLFALTKNASKTEDELRGICREKFGVTSMSQLSRDQYDKICGWLETLAGSLTDRYGAPAQ